MTKLKLNLPAAARPDAGFAVSATAKPERERGGNKSVRFECRMTPDEAARLDRSAKKAGLSRSDYVRSLIDGRTVQLVQVNVDVSRFDAILHELKKSGTNLNQLAHRLNRGESATLAEFNAMVEEHKRAARKVADFIDEIRPRR